LRLAVIQAVIAPPGLTAGESPAVLSSSNGEMRARALRGFLVPRIRRDMGVCDGSPRI